MNALSYEREGLARPCDVHADLLLVVVTAVAKFLLQRTCGFLVQGKERCTFHSSVISSVI